MCFLQFTVFNNERVSLAPVTAEDGRPVESKVKRFGEFPSGIAKEADLGMKGENLC